ncbi:MAG: hypothetical protein MK186_14245 [Henriciella sp.]|jgi:hypothetical protein|nr:hypothetical protein [Henriciella sp.]
MIVPLAFWLFLIGALALGWQAGDRFDRRIIIGIVVAVSLTAAARLSLSVHAASIAVLVTNAGLLAFVIRYAMVSHRHWPVWFAGFQTTTCALGLLALFFELGETRLWLVMASAFWTVPSLIVMFVGLLLDQRQSISNLPTL